MFVSLSTMMSGRMSFEQKIPTKFSSWHPIHNNKAILVIIIFSSFFFSLCHGSHYVKFHMSDFCDPNQKNVINLQPNSNMTAIMIKLKRESYKPNMNCSIYLTVPPGYGLMAFLTKLKLRRFNYKSDYIEFFSDSHSLIRFYGVNQELVPKKTIVTNAEQSIMMIRFFSESFYYSLPGKGFKIIVNIYAPINQNDECDAEMGMDVNCQNRFCIDSSLECDGFNNCRNDMDEMECYETSEIKISIYVFLATLAVMVMLIIMFMMKTKERRKQIVRRMSQAYANNHPILYVMENDGVSESSTTDSGEPIYDRPGNGTNSPFPAAILNNNNNHLAPPPVSAMVLKSQIRSLSLQPEHISNHAFYHI